MSCPFPLGFYLKAEDGKTESIPYRYKVNLAERTNCFKPNPLGKEFDHESHKPATLGAVYLGHMERLPVQSADKVVSVAREACAAVVYLHVFAMFTVFYVVAGLLCRKLQVTVQTMGSKV